jgi:hypothetical protein
MNPKKQRPVKSENRTVYALLGGENDGTIDALGHGVAAMVRLEPLLKGRESQVAVVLVAAFAEFLKERGEVVGQAVNVPETKK